MLRKLRIRNFQAHADLSIRFGRITTIVGRSDVGKSAVLRALRLVCLNDISGNAYVRDGQSTCSVSVRVGTTRIARVRGDRTNQYRIDGTKLEAFGSTVPDSVAKVLRVDPINFQGQHDSPFWLSDSSGQVSRALNRIVSLDVIDDFLSELNASLRASRADTTASEKAYADSVAWERRTRIAVRMNRELSVLERLATQIDAKAKRKQAIADGYQFARIRSDKLRRLIAEGKTLSDVERIADQLQARLSNRDALSGSVAEAERTASVLESQRTIPDVDNLVSQAERLRGMRAKRVVCDRWIREASDAKSRIARLSGLVAKDQRKLDSALRGRCPLCGRK